VRVSIVLPARTARPAAVRVPTESPVTMPWCCRYEDYLDSQITGTDMYYLEDLELARQLVELG
jgi:uncharacterized protein YlaN (UPF0358 family)